MSNLMYAATKEAREGIQDLRKQVKSIGHQFLTHVELSAQEAVYFILQMLLKYSSRDVIFINTSPPNERTVLVKSMKLIEQLPDDSSDIQTTSHIQRYACRPKALQDVCLADFASKYKINYTYRKSASHKSESQESDSEDKREDKDLYKIGNIIIKKRKKQVCIRYVRYQELTDQENYFREILMLFCPWTEESAIIGGKDTFTEQYRFLSKEKDIKSKMDEYNNKFPLLDQAIVDAENISEEILDKQWDQYAPSTRTTDKEDENEGPGSEVYPELIPPDISVADVHSASTEVSSCAILKTYMKDGDYFQLLRYLNVQQQHFFYHFLHHFKVSEEPI